MRSRNMVAALMALQLTACASIVDGTKQEVQVQTPGASCAQCEFTNSKGSYQSSCTPQKITVKRAYGPLTGTCVAPGLTGKSEYESKTKGWFFGNILIGGLIGMGVDALTGSAWDYPETLSVQMTPGQGMISRQPTAAAPSATSTARPAGTTQRTVVSNRMPGTSPYTTPRSHYSTVPENYQPLSRPQYPVAPAGQ